jgi:hypothetical protein
MLNLGLWFGFNGAALWLRERGGGGGGNVVLSLPRVLGLHILRFVVPYPLPT